MNMVRGYLVSINDRHCSCLVEERKQIQRQKEREKRGGKEKRTNKEYI